MANKRTFKKETTLLLELLFEECLFTREFNPAKAKEIDELLDEAVNLYTLTISARKTEKSTSYKEFYTALHEVYYTKILDILNSLEELRK